MGIRTRLTLNQQRGACATSTCWFNFNLSFIGVFKMTQRAMIAAAAAAVMSLSMVAMPAAAQEKEKCFGIAKAGQNDCASINGAHSCAGQSKVDMDKGEWKYVAKGTCKDMKGLSQDEAKAAAKK